MLYRTLLLCLTLCSWQLSANEDIYKYKLGAGDKINIKVYGEADLSLAVLLDTSGSIDYPYLGEINVVGFTPAEIKQAIYQGLKGDYLINPKVMVSIAQFRQFYIKGEVNKPGGYAFQPGLTVDKAIALAGGFTERAAKQSIMLSSNKSGDIARKVTLNDNVHPDNILNIEQSFF
jgi:protein involved in polysaccharide export with SLBB domain